VQMVADLLTALDGKPKGSVDIISDRDPTV